MRFSEVKLTCGMIVTALKIVSLRMWLSLQKLPPSALRYSAYNDLTHTPQKLILLSYENVIDFYCEQRCTFSPSSGDMEKRGI